MADIFDLIEKDGEVITGANAKMVNYLETVKTYRTVHLLSPVGQYNAMNAGASLVKTKYLYFTDNDVYFTENWLERMLDVYEADTRLGIVGGYTSPHHTILETHPLYKITQIQSAYSMLISKDRWDIFGPFTDCRNNYDGYGDTTLSVMCNNAGFKIGQPIKQVIYHCGLTNSIGQKTLGYYFETKQKFPKGCIYE